MTAGEANSHSGDRRFRRESDVVWRVASDRVLVRRVDASAAGDQDAELIGSAALTWAAADEASTASELSTATGLETAHVVAALTELIEAHWMRAT